MVQVSASSFQEQLGFATDCSCQVQCPRQAFDFARCVCTAELVRGCHSRGTEVASGSSSRRVSASAALRIAEGIARKTFLDSEQLGIFIRSKSNPMESCSSLLLY